VDGRRRRAAHHHRRRTRRRQRGVPPASAGDDGQLPGQRLRAGPDLPRSLPGPRTGGGDALRGPARQRDETADGLPHPAVHRRRLRLEPEGLRAAGLLAGRDRRGRGRRLPRPRRGAGAGRERRVVAARRRGVGVSEAAARGLLGRVRRGRPRERGRTEAPARRRCRTPRRVPHDAHRAGARPGRART
jgi:hypothetical protein